MANNIKADIKLASFEYEGRFDEPIFEPSRLYASIGGVYKELRSADNVQPDVRYPGGATTPSDTLVRLQLIKNHYTLDLSLSGFTFKADFVDWSQEPLITNIIENTAKALMKGLGTKPSSHKLQIVMQIGLPEGVSLRDFTKPFLPRIERPENDTEFCGFIVHIKDGNFFFDKSATIDNAMFASILRRFSGQVSFSEMAKTLLKEEMWLASTLGIEIT